ncbi:MAG: class I SAM-dependent methyltransferase [Bacteriovoracaceae bacterium]|jgi:SAM-dependent methyltransferase|nr:class I SAM-dependent methyltransferase [Bacteriovoracaceae bacterium]
MRSYYTQANDSYSRFTPDFLTSKNLNVYLEQNRESLVDFIEKYEKQFGALSTEKKLLELGCGLGGLSLYFSKRGFYTLGIDQSDLAISMAKEISKQNALFCKYRVMDVCLSRLEEKFDLLFDSHLFHCLALKEDRLKYYEFLTQVMDKNSRLFIETMVFDKKMSFPVGYLMQDNGVLYKDLSGKYVPYRAILETHEIESELIEAGFKIKYFYYHSELSFDLFCEYKGMCHESLPKTLRIVVSR